MPASPGLRRGLDDSVEKHISGGNPQLVEELLVRKLTAWWGQPEQVRESGALEGVPVDQRVVSNLHVLGDMGALPDLVARYDAEELIDELKSNSVGGI